MIIRDAKFPDLEALLPLMHEAHEKSVFADIPMNDATVQRSFVIAIQFGQFAKVSVRGGKVVGAMVGMIGENAYGIRCAQDLFCYSRGGTDLLIKAYKLWARDKGVQFAQITDLSGEVRYQKLITGLGFEPAGINFVEVA